VISIQVRPHCGSGIADVFAKSCALAAMLGVAVEFEFNNYECSAYGNGHGWLFWKCESGWEPSIAGRYEDGKVEYFGGERKKIKPIDTPPPTTP